MRPVPTTFLFVLLLALCGLCSWQWARESELRQVVSDQRGEIQQLTTFRDELEGRAKAADAEILRLTGSLAELRTQSVSKESLDEQLEAAAKWREMSEKQSAALKQQSDAINQQNVLMRQANETIKKVTDERDQITKKLNDVTALYNKLAQDPPKSS